MSTLSCGPKASGDLRCEYDMAYVFETSGRQLLCGPYGKWIASAPAAQRRQILAENPSIREDWDDEFGDRMVCSHVATKIRITSTTM